MTESAAAASKWNRGEENANSWCPLDTVQRRGTVIFVFRVGVEARGSRRLIASPQPLPARAVDVSIPIDCVALATLSQSSSTLDIYELRGECSANCPEKANEIKFDGQAILSIIILRGRHGSTALLLTESPSSVAVSNSISQSPWQVLTRQFANSHCLAPLCTAFSVGTGTNNRTSITKTSHYSTSWLALSLSSIVVLLLASGQCWSIPLCLQR